jgi:hypothetical protein
MFGSEVGGLSAGVASHRRRGVESADEVQQADTVGQLGVDGGVKVLDAVESKQHGVAGVAVGHAKLSQRSVHGVDHHGVLGPLLGAGEETLSEGCVDSRVGVPRGGTGQSGRSEVAGMHGSQAFGCGSHEAGVSSGGADGEGGARWVGGSEGGQKWYRVWSVVDVERATGHGLVQIAPVDGFQSEADQVPVVLAGDGVGMVGRLARWHIDGACRRGEQRGGSVSVVDSSYPGTSSVAEHLDGR